MRKICISVIVTLLITGISFCICIPFIINVTSPGGTKTDYWFVITMDADLFFSWVCAISGLASLILLVVIAKKAFRVWFISNQKEFRSIGIMSVLGIFIPVFLGIAAASYAIHTLDFRLNIEMGEDYEKAVRLTS